jgi:gamma-glutamyltranspeptidase/glutathione hydrolase
MIAMLIGLLAAPISVGAAVGQHGVVSSEHRLASEAGIEILRRGGNAVDAAVATALAVGVVNPSSCGIGGGGFMVIFDRHRGEVAALDYRETAPAAASRDMFVRNGQVDHDLSVRGGLAVGVPGEIAGLHAALQRFGSLPFRDIAAPAIRLAREGFLVEAHLAKAIASQSEQLRKRPPLAALFFGDEGEPLEEGERLRQPDLADTLELIAREGPRAFYEGRLPAAMVEAVRTSGGALEIGDFAAYRPVWRAPIEGRLGAYRIFGMPPPSSGGGLVIELVRMLGRDDFQALGQSSPTYLHLLAEAMQFGFADRAEFYGDPDFVEVPLRRLLSPARLRALRRRMSAATTFSPSFYGHRSGANDGGTSHLSVIDARGNAVACTTSINTAFGSMVRAPGTGVLLNNTMDDFSAQPGTPNVYGLIGSEANSIAPGKRPLSSMTPTIVLRGDEVAAVAGASGGPFIISGTLQALLNALVFGQDAEAAVATPRIHHQWLPPVLMVEVGIEPATRQTLQRLGHRLVQVPGISAVQLALRRSDGTLEGAADPRKGGLAVAW